MSRGQNIIGALVIGIAVIVAVTFDFNKSDTGNERPLAQLADKNNNPVEFSSFKGKVVFVNNWASWCAPCIAEMPSIAELKGRLKAEDVVFVMVSFDEKPEKAHRFMEEKGYDFEVYFPGKNYPFVTSSIPATFILDKTGKVVDENTGMADYSGEKFASQLMELSDE